MEKKKISAIMVADSISPQGHRITTFLLTYPRMVHSDFMSHRMFSRNTASSRAIPFEKMLKMVVEDPFIPIAFQKDHKGMQGTEYLDPNKKISWNEIFPIIIEAIKRNFYNKETNELNPEWGDILVIFNSTVTPLFIPMERHGGYTPIEWWLKVRDLVVSSALLMSIMGVSKQLCNRLLEPFMWHTALLTATEFDNFFELRCPKYLDPSGESFKSKKDYRTSSKWSCWEGNEDDVTGWLECDDSQAEIHIQALAEAMWDAMNESTPKELKAGEWHIPFGDKFDIQAFEANEGIEVPLEQILSLKLKISTARCARLSYMTFDGEVDYKKDIELHDRLLESRHMSPFEHCAVAMSDTEYELFVKGRGKTYRSGEWETYDSDKPDYQLHFKPEDKGWCNNFKGFIPYRYLIENK